MNIFFTWVTSKFSFHRSIYRYLHMKHSTILMQMLKHSLGWRWGIQIARNWKTSEWNETQEFKKFLLNTMTIGLILSPIYQYSFIYPFPHFFPFTQTNPIKVMIWCTLLQKLLSWWKSEKHRSNTQTHIEHTNTYYFFAHLFLFAVYNHQICSSLLTVSSAVTPALRIRWNVI